MTTVVSTVERTTAAPSAGVPSRPAPGTGFSPRRLAALVRKESLQVVRDPSAILIAFVLPVVLLFLFAYAVSLDIRRVPLGVVLESDSAPAQGLAAAFAGTRYFDVHHTERDTLEQVEPAALAQNVAAWAVTAWLAAQAPLPFGPATL